MPHFKLVPTGRSDSQVDELVISRDEGGEVEHSLSVHEARSIPEEILDEAREIAGKHGLQIADAPAPDEDQVSEEQQSSEPGADVQGGGGNQATQQGSGGTTGGSTPGGLSTPSSAD